MQCQGLLASMADGHSFRQAGRPTVLVSLLIGAGQGKLAGS